MNKHREIIYKKRREILESAEAIDGPKTEPIIMAMVEEQLRELVTLHASLYSADTAAENAKSFLEAVAKILPLGPDHAKKLFEDAQKGFDNTEAWQTNSRVRAPYL